LTRALIAKISATIIWGFFENPQITVAEKWTDKVDKTDGQKTGRPFVAEVARIVTVNRNYGPVITAAGRYVSSETYLTVYYIEYISTFNINTINTRII
jgi:hypothetical protein